MSRREFQLVEGTSKKFWAIELNGKSHTVNFGRIGTAGQTQTKDFTSEADAKTAYDKLIAEKVKKGYTEVSAAAAAPAAPAAKSTPKSKKTESATPEPPPPVPASPPPPEPAGVSHTIELEPEDYLSVVWRKRVVQKRPEPPPFDFEQCRKRLDALRKDKYGWVNWSPAAIAKHLSRQEAHFWFLAVTANYENLNPPTVAERMNEKEITGKMDVADVLKRLKSVKHFSPDEGFCALFNLFDAVEVVELLQKDALRGTHWDYSTEGIEAFHRLILPHLSAEELKRIRDELRPLIDPSQWPANHYTRPHTVFFLAALVGLPDELLAVVRSIPDNHYAATGWDHSHYHQTQRIVFGLGSAELVEAEMRRLKLPIHEPEYIRGWLAHTEFAALDYIRDNILAETRRDECEKLIREFARVKAPEAAPHMLELKLSAKGGAPARQWLDEQVGNAIAGLLPTAASRGKLAEAAIDYLRDAKRKGHEASIRSALAGVKPEVTESIRKNVLDFTQKEYPLLTDKAMPVDLKSALVEKGKSSLPAWVSAAALPQIVVNEHRLSDEQTTLVIEGLRRSTLDAVGPLVAAVKKYADPASLDTFAWKLFQLWQGEGYPSKEKWAMGAIGHFGGDSSALKITPLIRNWPGESQHARAVFGLECLRTIGSDTALMQLNGISQKLKFKGLKQKAAEAMEAIAKEKGLTRAQLEDRVVPDCDLDERGQRIFDFGSRQFRFVLGPQMKPMVKDADGKVKPDLPKPGTKDDATKANEAVAAWKLMKKQIKEVANLQAQRLEQAMVTGRRWPVEDFEALLVKHPLMIHLVRLLLWGGYDKDGKLKAPFRVTEDQTYADAKDAPFTLKGIESVGLVHPLNLTEEQKAAWGEVFGDYEIVPPFPQLGRSIYRLEKGEEKESTITRFDGLSLPAPSMVFGLENRGWIRGYGMDGGGFDEHSKPFPGSNVTAVIHYDGMVAFGFIDPNESLSFKGCYFVTGLRGPSGYAHNEKTLALSKVDPIAVSEVLSDLSALAAKAK